MGETVRVGLLGPLQLRDPAGREIPVGGRRARMLIIMLALDAGRVVPVASLIGRLWPDARPGDAGNALQSLVSRLRTRLRAAGADDSVIESGPGGYRLAIPPGAVDAVLFESLARRGAQALAAGDPARAAEVLDEALRQWRGPALADAADDDVAARQAARLAELREAATLDRIESGLVLGAAAGLVGEVRAIVAADPLAERPRALLMRALYADGREAEALQVYQEGREVLAAELGVDPSPQLERVYLGVLRRTLADPDRPGAGRPRPPGGEPAVREPRLTNLREPLTSFVGRDNEVRHIVKLLAEERLVTLTGPGGVGKTRLAREAAAMLAAGLGGEPGEGAAPDTAPDRGGVWFVELAPVTCAEDVPHAVLDVLGLRDVSMLGTDRGQAPREPEPLRRLVSGLGGRDALLVLDNCEHLVGAAAAFADRVLGDCPRLRILATSREPLGIGGERLWSVPPLPVPPGDGAGLTAGEVGSYPAVRLLLDRAAAAHAGQQLTDGSAGTLARICRMLDGMPLAIELAAPRLRMLSPAQLAGRLDDRFRLLTAGNRAAMPRHQTLRAVVDWSWELLSEPERILARRLAVFPGGATLTSAEHVCSGSSLAGADVLPALAGLVDKSFLVAEHFGRPGPRADGAGGDGAAGGGEAGQADPEPRYRMLETIRAYALERLAGTGEERQVRKAMCRWFLELAETAEPRLRGHGQRYWMNVLIAEQDNVYAAMRWAVGEGDAEVALRFGRALTWYWMLRGHRAESVALAREAMSVPLPWAEADIPADIADARVACALCEMVITGRDWDLEESRQALADALAVADRVGRPPGRDPDPVVAMAAPVLALVGADLEEAVRQLSALLDVADPWLRAVAQMTYANMAMTSGRPREAAGHADASLAAFRQLGDDWGQAMGLFLRSQVCALDGDHTAAIHALEEAAGIIGDLSDSIDLAHIYLHLARQRAQAGDMAGARAEVDRGARMAGAKADEEWALWAQFFRMELGWLEGRLAEAEALGKRLDQKMERRTSIFWKAQRGIVRARLALLTLGRGDTERADALLAEALDLASVTFDRPALAAVIDSIAVFALQRAAGGDGHGAPAGPGGAELAATLLGAGHSIRGAFDHGSLDAPAAREGARRALGDSGFDAAYERGRALGYEQAVAFAGQVLRR